MNPSPSLVVGLRARFRHSGRAGSAELLVAEWRKMRSTWILPLVVLGPLGVTLMGVIYYALNASHIAAKIAAGTPPWTALLNAMGMVQVFSLMLGTTLLASQIADVDHRSDTWKQLFAMPVPRAGTFLAKALWLAALLAAASLLMVGGYAVLWLWRGYGPLPLAEMARAAAMPFLAALPLAAFQLVLSTEMRNQAAPLTAGILGTMFGMVQLPLPGWMPWRIPFESMAAVYGKTLEYPQLWQAVGIEVGVLLVAGAVLMSRREVR